MSNPEAPPTVNNNNNNWTESKSFFIGLIALVLVVVEISIRLGGYFDNSKEIVDLRKENARLNTLVLNHTDKLDNDTVVAQHLLSAATTALSSCKK